MSFESGVDSRFAFQKIFHPVSPLKSHSNGGNENAGDENGSHWRGNKSWGGRGPFLLAGGVSIWTSFKHLIGYEKITLDDDPLKARIKESWIARKYGKHQEAVDILHSALEEMGDREDKEVVLTRIYDELANTYLEMGRLEEADKLFRQVLSRLVQIHKRKDKDPEFIGVSLKLADIFAQKGDYINAEIGFVHCLEKQDGVVEDLRRKNKGSLISSRVPVSEIPSYGDMVALLGMVLESYAHFLLAIPPGKEGANRFDDSELLAFRAVEAATEVYGPNAAQTLNVLNNYGVRCLLSNRFETAARFARQVVRRSQLSEDVDGDTLAGYYCNCAEAVFHDGCHDEALVYARRAMALASRWGVSEKIQEHAKKFCKDMELDYKKVTGKKAPKDLTHVVIPLAGEKGRELPQR